MVEIKVDGRNYALIRRDTFLVLLGYSMVGSERAGSSQKFIEV